LQPSNRIGNLQSGASLPEFQCFRAASGGKVQEITISRNEIIRMARKSEVNIRLIVRITGSRTTSGTDPIGVRHQLVKKGVHHFSR